MKKNWIMRLASCLMVLAVLSTCAVSGTYAKYVTSTSGSDSARVAKWGFTDTDSTKMKISDLFANAYDNTVKSTVDVVAPGTTKSTTFAFTYGGDTAAAAPEVDYTFKVAADITGSYAALDANPNFTWTLDDTSYNTVADLKAAILKLSGAASGSQTYKAGTLPDAFKATGDNQHTIGWNWAFETAGDGKDAQDVTDTEMGNATALDNVAITITITATQID